MSKRNKHHKPKGPKAPPQNVLSEEKPPTEEQPVVETKPAEEAKPIAVTIPEIKPPQTEVKPETSLPKEGNKNSDVADNAKSSETPDSPVKPKRHRNRKNKNKDNQGNSSDSKDDLDDEVKVLSEVGESVKLEEKVEKVSETPVKSEPSDQKDSEPKKSGRNKKKDKRDAQQTVPEKATETAVVPDVQSAPEISVPVAEDKSKKGNKSDAQTQVKSGKGKQGQTAPKVEKKHDDGKTAVKTTEKVEEEKCTIKEEETKIKEGPESKSVEETTKVQQPESKSEKNKKGKNKKHHEDNKPDVQVQSEATEKKDDKADVCEKPEKEKIVEIKEQTKEENVRHSEKSDKKDSEKVKDKPSEQEKKSGDNKSKGKQKQGAKEEKIIEEDNATAISKSIEQALIEEVKATELTSQIESCETKQCDLPKGKKQKGKQHPPAVQHVEFKEVPEEKCGLVSLSSILGKDTPLGDIEKDDPSKCSLMCDTLSVKKDRKSKSKTPEPKPKHDKPETCKIKDDVKKIDSAPEIIKNLEIKDISKRRSKTPEVAGSQTEKKEIEPIVKETNLPDVKTETLPKSPIQSEIVKEEVHKQLNVKEQKKGRSKTPEIKIQKEDAPQMTKEPLTICEKKEEIKIEEKCSKKQKGKEKSHEKQIAAPATPDTQVSSEQPVKIEIKECSISAPEISALISKDKNKGRSKTQEIKVIPDVKEEKPEVLVESVAAKPEDVCVGKLMDHIKPHSNRKSRSRTPEVKVESAKVQEKVNLVDDISIASSIEESLERLVSDCENIAIKKEEKPSDEKPTDLKILAEQRFELPPFGGAEIKPVAEEKHSEGDKCQDKHKKNKKSGNKETKTPTEGEKHKKDDSVILPTTADSTCTLKTSEAKGTIQKIEEFVVQNPISEDIISALLSDIPPEFIDADVDSCKLPVGAEILACPMPVCPIVSASSEKPISCPMKEKLVEPFTSAVEMKCDLQEKPHDTVKSDEHAHDKGNKNKSKKHDKKKGHQEEVTKTEIETKETVILEKPEIISLPEPSPIDAAQEVQIIDVHKTVETVPTSEPKPTKRNKDKKHKDDQHDKKCQIQAKESLDTPAAVEIKPIVLDTPVVTEIISPNIEAAHSAGTKENVQQCEIVKQECKPECENKPCETCPKKKKSNKDKGKHNVQTLEQELAEACHLEKPEDKGKDKQALNITEATSSETLTKTEQKEVAQARPENFEFLKLPEETKVTDTPDSHSKDKNKRGSKSPAKQSKNLHGPSSSPAKSSKCDYKKEKNKGDKKSPPDTSQIPAEPEPKTQDIKCELGESSHQKTDKKGKNKGEEKPEAISIENVEDLEEEFVYKYSFRTVFIANACHICKIQLKDDRVVCRFCHLVCYCTEGHRDDDWASHQSLCYAICTLSHVKAQDHIYGDAKSLSGQDYRLLRMQGIVSCEKILKRKLCPWEQEVLLYPRMCLEPTCREWRSGNLKDCDGCGQVSYCIAHPTHLPTDHASWCASYRLYHRLVAHQLHQGRIEPALPTKVFQQDFHLPDDTTTLYDTLYGGPQQMDECYHATLTQLSTAPLTALYAYQKTAGATTQGGQPTTSKILAKTALCIHIIGAELQFEADTLNKWESFFLHLTPGLQDLRIVFIGPELNTSNLPVDLLSRIRMCQLCKEGHRIVRFEFHDSMLYHDFVESSKFSKPDLICAFNPGFHRATGYAGLDTWPETIGAALRLRVPLCITAYTQYEMPRDLARIHTVCPNAQIKVGPIKNPYASLRPDRNFISDDEMPLIFKNYQFAVVTL